MTPISYHYKLYKIDSLTVDSHVLTELKLGNGKDHVVVHLSDFTSHVKINSNYYKIIDNAILHIDTNFV
jgi:hypothetical protein